MGLKILRKWWLWAWLIFATPVVVLVTAGARAGSAEFQYRAARWVSRWWSRGMLRVTGSTCKVEGLEHVSGRGPYIVMSNHRSVVDTPVLIEHLPFLFGFIVKAELMRIPVFAAGMKSIGCVAVKRSGSRRDHDALGEVAQDVASGKNILIFPEGTRSPSDAFLPFKKGGAILAIKAGVPVLPVAVSGTNRVIPAGLTTVTPGELLLRIGEPIVTQGLTIEDRDALTDKVRGSIEALYIPGYPTEA